MTSWRGRSSRSSSANELSEILYWPMVVALLLACAVLVASDRNGSDGTSTAAHHEQARIQGEAMKANQRRLAGLPPDAPIELLHCTSLPGEQLHCE